MAYSRATLSGQPVVAIKGATGAAVINIPNWGVSVMGETSADTYVLAPPVAGCRKTLVFTNTSSTIANVVRLSTTAGAGTVSIAYGSTIQYTYIKKAATASTIQATVVELTGINSTSWLMTNAWPCSTAPTIANWGGCITLSTT
jgi:hypothetical protein